MAYQDRSQDFPSVSNADYGSVIEVDFDSFEPSFPMDYHCNMPVGTRKGFRQRWTLLVNEPRRLYNAMSFLTWQTGLYFNVHVTLTASSLGFADYRKFLALMPHWHKEMNRCLFDGVHKVAGRDRQGGRARRVSRRDLVRVDHPHYWMGVVEYARDHGVHVHVLCVVPKYAVRAFEERTWSWWRMKSPGMAQANGIAFGTRHPSIAERAMVGRLNFSGTSSKQRTNTQLCVAGKTRFIERVKFLSPIPMTVHRYKSRPVNSAGSRIV